MAEPGTKEQGEQDAKQEQTIRQRIALDNAYAALLGEQTNQTFAAFTFEEALDLQIEQIQGAGDDAHPNLLNRVERIRSQLLQAVEQIEQVDPSQFQQIDDQAVNTPVDPEA
jgi:hypothetical protein